jgi:two-component system, response regulator / RNA-binding antiterminator
LLIRPQELGSDMAGSDISVAIVDENLVRAAILEDGLRSAGIGRVTVVNEMLNLLRRLVSIDPDVVIIDLENPSRDVLEQMFQVSRLVARPVAMFVDRSDSAMIQAAVDAGVSAYIVDGLKKERVRAIVDMAISRFNAFARMAKELEDARNELAARKVIERAKGILMTTRGFSEEEAYAALRKAAMSESRKLIDIAQSVVTAAHLLG